MVCITSCYRYHSLLLTLLPSNVGTTSFQQVVNFIAAAGVERYHNDLVRGVVIYYTPHEWAEASYTPVSSSVGSFNIDGMRERERERECVCGGDDVIDDVDIRYQ